MIIDDMKQSLREFCEKEDRNYLRDLEELKQKYREVYSRSNVVPPSKLFGKDIFDDDGEVWEVLMLHDRSFHFMDYDEHEFSVSFSFIVGRVLPSGRISTKILCLDQMKECGENK